MNKKLALIGGAIVLLLLLGGGYFVMNSGKSADQTPTPALDTTIGTLSPEDIGLELVPSSDKKKIKIVVAKAEDIKELEYEVTYEADIPASEKLEGAEGERTERGFGGEEVIKSGQTKFESKFLDLGSCSKNVCRYDTGVEEINIIMKVTKRDGKIYQVEDSVQL